MQWPQQPVPRVLVAEDDPEMRRLVVETLVRAGYDVREAVDGGRLLVNVTAWYQHPESTVDLVISDVRMPICSGLEILKGLRAARWQVPVILMTAFGDDETRARAESLGAVLFDKPFAMRELRDAVEKLCPLAR